MSYLPRDFIETKEGLIFAVVDAFPEQGKVLCALRYVPDAPKARKLSTEEANTFLGRYYPRYLYHSQRLDVDLHAVEEARIRRHYRPCDRLQGIQKHGPADAVEAKLCRLLEQFATHGLDLTQLGVTGSLLVATHTAVSDFDLVTYRRSHFFAARDIVQRCLATGVFNHLDESAWQDAYRRRGCSLSYEEFLWHERRKGNKALFEGTKFDLTLVTTNPNEALICWHKLGPMTIRATVSDASAAYDYPACYRLDHPEISQIVVFTQTYVGQAVSGETIEAAGRIECDSEGRRRLVVGASREAPSEYIRVLGHT